MDPLSISMSIITVIGATRSTIKAAKSLYNAPDEVDSLLNDLSDAELMIRDIQSSTEKQDKTHRVSPQEQALQDQLIAAESIVVQLKELVSEVLTKSNTARRVAWLRAKKKTRRLTRKLARIHEELPRHYGYAEGSRITLGLANISSVQIDMSSGLSRLENQVDETSQSISQLREAVLSSQQQQEQTISSIEDLRQDTSNRLQKLESAMLSSNDLLQRLPEILTLQIQTSQQVSTLTRSTQARIGSSTDQPPEAASSTTTSTIQSTYQSIMIRSQYQYPNSCDLNCHCCCHSLQAIASPSFLNNLLGGIFVGYKGLPSFAKKCNTQKCKRDSEPKVYFTYFFPQWWVINRMIILLAQWTMARGPELVLRFPRRVGDNSAVFRLAQTGNIEGLKLLFDNGKASPNDLNNLNMTVLHYANTRVKNLDTIKFLIQAGADTQAEDEAHSTFEDRACIMAFMKTRPLRWQQWALDYYVSRRSEHFEFSVLHEIILELRYTSLKEEISRCSRCYGAIDTQDIWGYTPLHWASARGNFQAVCQLLEAGANPNITNKDGCPPLHISARYGRLDCAMQLLQYGASLQYSDAAGGWTTLLLVCACMFWQPSSSKIIEFLDAMFNMGLDIDARLANGWNSLFYSLQSSPEGGKTPLRWLLDHGADYRIKSLTGATILHVAGESGNLETIQILREANISGIDIYAKYYDTGLTAMDEMLDPDRYPPTSPEVIESFKLLLTEIEARTNGQAPPAETIVVDENYTVLSNSPTSMANKPSIALGSVEPSVQDSDSEDDLVFQDSVEYHVSTTMK